MSGPSTSAYDKRPYRYIKNRESWAASPTRWASARHQSWKIMHFLGAFGHLCSALQGQIFLFTRLAMSGELKSVEKHSSNEKDNPWVPFSRARSENLKLDFSAIQEYDFACSRVFRGIGNITPGCCMEGHRTQQHEGLTSEMSCVAVQMWKGH